MAKEETTKEITSALEKMNCYDLLFFDINDNEVVVTFNCKDLTSFTSSLPGWSYTGIELDDTQKRQYKIRFMKI
jgi:hypothetical protein